jgi:transmembrane sensor
MNAKEDPVRELIAQEAADWFVAYRAGLDDAQRAAFTAWLRTSRVHIEEYLNITLIARDLREACNDPDVALENLLAEASASDESQPMRARPHELTSWQRWKPRPWLSAAAVAGALGVLTLAFLFWRNSTHAPEGGGNGAMYYVRTGHGEQLDRRLPDNSVLHLNTDTSLWVLYDRKQRVVGVVSGQAEFDVTHDPTRKFVVMAGTVGITDIGTRFDVYARPDSTVITVLEGRVAVEDHSNLAGDGTGSASRSPPHVPVEVSAGRQLRVQNGSWPPVSSAIDAQRATAWLRRQIVFEKQPLEQVAAEFNRYAAIPIHIDSPALRTLPISGVFSADDTESFVAFLRSLNGVQVEVTPAEIRVSHK